VRPPTERARAMTVILGAVASTAMGLLPIWLFGGLAVQIRADLDFDVALLGVATAVYFAVAAIASTPGGRIVERIGWRRGVLVTALISGCSLVGIALGASSWLVLVGFLAVGGIANGTAQPAANLGLASDIGPRHRGLAFGIKQAAIPLTTMIAGLAVPLIGLTLGWRWAFGLTAVVGVPVVMGLLARSGRAAPSTPVGPGDNGGSARQPALGVLFAAAMVATAATNSLGSFLVSFAAGGALGPEGAGYLYAGASAVGIASRVLAGWQADRRGRRHFRATAIMMLGGTGGFALLAVGEGPGLTIIAAVLCFGLGWSWNGVFAFAIVEASPDAPASATGVIQTAKNLGGVIGPLGFGFLVSAFSFELAWLVTASLMGLAAGLMLLGGHLAHHDEFRYRKSDN
jgi:MFS family permease